MKRHLFRLNGLTLAIYQLLSLFFLLFPSPHAFSQIQFCAGPSAIWYNVHSNRGVNIFDSNGPYFMPGLHARAGWEVSPHVVVMGQVHFLLPKEEITSTMVHARPVYPAQSIKVQDLFTTQASAGDIFVKWYLAGGIETPTRAYLSVGPGFTRFTRTHQLSPYDTVVFSTAIPATQHQNIFPFNIAFGFETDVEVAYLYAEGRFSGGLTGNNAQYLGIDAGVGIPFRFRKKETVRQAE